MYIRTLQNLSVPDETDAVFVRPQLQRWPSMVMANRTALAQQPHHMQWRDELLSLAGDFTRNVLNQPGSARGPHTVIATGHQAGWHHCGIWVKDVVTAKCAAALSGTGIHLIVDHDSSDTSLYLFCRDAQERHPLGKLEIEANPETLPLELRKSPGIAHIKRFLKTVTQTHPGSFCGTIWSQFIEADGRCIPTFDNIANLITYFTAALNTALNLEMLYLPVSLLSQSSAFVNFAAGIMAEAPRFARNYNDAIKEQIEQVGISPRQTLCPLMADMLTGTFDLPFWLLCPDGTRTTLRLRQNDAFRLVLYNDTISIGDIDTTDVRNAAGQLQQILSSCNCRLRPKAVTLTLFARVFLADWFIHGVGGARYEYITDCLIRTFFGIHALAFGVATMTAALPLPNPASTELSTRSACSRQLRILRYNPETFISSTIRQTEPARSLIGRKIALSRLAADAALPGHKRRKVRSLITRLNAKLLTIAQKNEDTTQLLNKNEKSNNFREYFFGLFDQHKLNEILNAPMFPPGAQ